MRISLHSAQVGQPVRPPLRSGFTLVEMLIVVLILAILIGVSVRMLQMVRDQKEKAITMQRLEKLKAAIEVFYNEYGHYPPVDHRYVFNDQVDYLVPDVLTINNEMTRWRGGADWEEDYPLFCFGLLAYLMPRFQCDMRYDLSIMTKQPYDYRDMFNNPQWRNKNRDFNGNALLGNGERDELAWELIKPYIDDIIIPHTINTGIGEGGYRGRGNHALGFPSVEKRADPDKPNYYLMQFTVWDGWQRPFHYRSDPPYMTYKLWSDGGRNGPIYGDVGF